VPVLGAPFWPAASESFCGAVLIAGTAVPFDGRAEAPESTSKKLAPADFVLASGAVA
jgi:hypothetical protein